MIIFNCKKTFMWMFILLLVFGGLSCNQKSQKTEDSTQKEFVNKVQGSIKIPQSPPKILLIQYDEKFNTWDYGPTEHYWKDSIPTGQGHKNSFGKAETTLGLYCKSYPDSLKKLLGIDLKVISPSELIEEMKGISEDKAEEIANRWIREAEAIVETEKEYIIRSGRMYLAVKNLLEKYNANAWSVCVREAGPLETPVKNIIGMPPLAEMQSYLDGVPTCCEVMPDCLVTQMIGTYISGRPVFIGDRQSNFLFKLKPKFKQPEDIAMYGHCYMPINPNGGDRMPYIIRSHLHGDQFPSMLTHWPIGETVTIIKCNVWEKEISVFTGKIVDADFYFQDFAETSCRNKLVVKVDNYKDCEASEDCYLFPITTGGKGFRNMDKWGYHDGVFCGDYEDEILKLAELIGFDVITAEGVIKNPKKKVEDGKNLAEIVTDIYRVNN